jgi:hypothetical protein
MVTNGHDAAFDHFIRTGKYVWNNREYTDPPHRLEVGLGSGVMQVRNLLMDSLILRITGLTNKMLWTFSSVSDTVYINLQTPVKKGEAPTISGVKTVEPVFLQLPQNVPGKYGQFVIVNESGEAIFLFSEVPVKLLMDLWTAKLVNISLRSK